MAIDTHSNSITLVAIAKNEGPYLLEWIAHHLAIGVSRIIVYDNESTDHGPRLLAQIARHHAAIETRPWISAGITASPQTGAYNDALARVETDWVMFLDIDEFLVPWRDLSIQAFLARVPSDAGSVHLNWLGFGSSGLQEPDYGFVTKAFTRCSHPLWGNNHHFKSIARTLFTTEAFIHDIETSDGRRLLSDFREFETASRGLSSRIVHDGIQINHYQAKTFAEFSERMKRGDANYHPDHELRRRDSSLERFAQLDVNDDVNTAIAVFTDAHRAQYDHLVSLLNL